MSCTIREATIEDTATLLELIRGLAEYEKLLHEVVADEATLRCSLFGDQPTAFAIIAEYDGAPGGFALYFYNFSTFLGRPGLYIEDIYVKPEMRGKGIGKALFAWLAQKSEEKQCGRMEWWVLDWNKPSIDFYKSMGAEAMEEWTVFRLNEHSINKIKEVA